MKWFMPMAQKKEMRGAKSSTLEPGLDAGAQVFQPVGQRVSQLDVGRGAGFLHVVAADADAVELRHLLRAVAEDVADDPHRRRGRIDVGVADHELFENVVLDGAAQLLRRHALLLGGDDVERHDGQHRAVHGHRDRHLVQRNLVEEDLHVEDGVDGHAGLADVAGARARGRSRSRDAWQIEGDRKPLLAGGEIAAVKGVRLLGRGEAGILADRPRLHGVHGRVRAAQEGRNAGGVFEVLHAFEHLAAQDSGNLDVLRREPEASRRLALGCDWAERGTRTTIGLRSEIDFAEIRPHVVNPPLPTAAASASTPGARCCERG